VNPKAWLSHTDRAAPRNVQAVTAAQLTYRVAVRSHQGSKPLSMQCSMRARAQRLK
jgi:hypothetical protein